MMSSQNWCLRAKKLREVKEWRSERVKEWGIEIR
jgi:hypothetical protein